MDGGQLGTLLPKHHGELCLPENQTCTFHYVAVKNEAINVAILATIQSTSKCVVKLLMVVNRSAPLPTLQGTPGREWRKVK